MGTASMTQIARVKSWRAVANGFEIGVEAPSGGVLVSSVSWARGWRVEGQGAGNRQRPEMARANGAFLAVEVPPGITELSLKYEPRGFRWAWLLSALGCLACLRAGLRHDS